MKKCAGKGTYVHYAGWHLYAEHSTPFSNAHTSYMIPNSNVNFITKIMRMSCQIETGFFFRVPTSKNEEKGEKYREREWKRKCS